MKWAFGDFDSECARADLNTLSERDIKAVAEPLAMRAIQFSLFVRALLGKDAMAQIMQDAVRYAKE